MSHVSGTSWESAAKSFLNMLVQAATYMSSLFTFADNDRVGYMETLNISSKDSRDRTQITGTVM